MKPSNSGEIERLGAGIRGVVDVPLETVDVYGYLLGDSSVRMSGVDCLKLKGQSEVGSKERRNLSYRGVGARFGTPHVPRDCYSSTEVVA